MEKDLIKDALLSAFVLLNNEIESVLIEDLQEEYLAVIHKVEIALKSMEE